MFGKRIRFSRRHRSDQQRLVKSRHALFQPLEERRLLAIDALAGFDLSAFSAENVQDRLEVAEPVTDATTNVIRQKQVALSAADASLGQIVTDDTFYLLRNVITFSQDTTTLQFVSDRPLSQALADPDIREQVTAAGCDFPAEFATMLCHRAIQIQPHVVQMGQQV